MRLDRVLVEGVHLGRLRDSLRGSNLIGDRLDRREVATGQEDLRALARERSGDCPADRTTRPVDDRVLVLEHHGFSPCAACAALS